MKCVGSDLSACIRACVDDTEDGLFIFGTPPGNASGVLANQLATENTVAGIVTEDSGQPIITES